MWLVVDLTIVTTRNVLRDGLDDVPNFFNIKLLILYVKLIVGIDSSNAKLDQTTIATLSMVPIMSVIHVPHGN